MNLEKLKVIMKKDKLKKKLLGNNNDGVMYKIFVYFFLISVGFIFLYPILTMISYSFKDGNDIVNPLVNWIPSNFYLGNYEKALAVLDFKGSMIETIYVTAIPALIQTLSCSLIGYGFARFKFPGKNILFFLVIATFIIPPQITVIPQFLMFKDLGLLESILAYILPALFGQGIKSAIFILIFFQFFKMMPKVLEEAAQVDGAGPMKIFFRIAVPMAVPAYIISFLFSFVWYWNETYLATMFLGGELQTLPMKLQQFAASFQKLFPATVVTGQSLNEAVEMAGTCLNIVPLLIVYFVAQKWFVEGIDRAGITGE